MHGIAQSAQRRLRLGNGEFQPVPGDAAMDLLSWSELLGEQHAGQFLVQFTPDGPAQRSRAVFRLIATIDYPVDGVIVEAQGDVLRSQPLPGLLQKELGDRAKPQPIEATEQDDLVDPVEELRPEVPSHGHHERLPHLFD